MKKNETKSDTQIWDSYRNIIRSRKGGWRIGQGVFSHGFNLLEDLAGHISFFQLLILNATGRLPDRCLGDWLEALQICLSWPDPRIWCNQIGALGGTLRASAVASTAAGVLAADSKIYGPQTIARGMEFIQNSLNKRRNGVEIQEILAKHIRDGKPCVMGFVRPITKGDERISTMERITQRLGFTIGDHMRLALDIEKFMLEKFGESMNISGYISAFLSDQGFSPQEAYQISASLVTSGVTACYIDSFERPAETFFPSRCDDVVYKGPPPRRVP